MKSTDCMVSLYGNLTKVVLLTTSTKKNTRRLKFYLLVQRLNHYLERTQKMVTFENTILFIESEDLLLIHFGTMRHVEEKIIQIDYSKHSSMQNKKSQTN